MKDDYEPLNDVKVDTLKLIRKLINERPDEFDEYIAERNAWKRGGVDGE